MLSSQDIVDNCYLCQISFHHCSIRIPHSVLRKTDTSASVHAIPHFLISEALVDVVVYGDSGRINPVACWRASSPGAVLPELTKKSTAR